MKNIPGIMSEAQAEKWEIKRNEGRIMYIIKNCAIKRGWIFLASIFILLIIYDPPPDAFLLLTLITGICSIGIGCAIGSIGWNVNEVLYKAYKEGLDKSD
jgi:hypothetical protein